MIKDKVHRCVSSFNKTSISNLRLNNVLLSCEMHGLLLDFWEAEQSYIMMYPVSVCLYNNFEPFLCHIYIYVCLKLSLAYSFPTYSTRYFCLNIIRNLFYNHSLILHLILLLWVILAGPLVDQYDLETDK
jgi:hypothetical protein